MSGEIDLALDVALVVALKTALGDQRCDVTIEVRSTGRCDHQLSHEKQVDEQPFCSSGECHTLRLTANAGFKLAGGQACGIHFSWLDLCPPVA